MNRKEALLHWHRSVRALEAAELLARSGYGEDAISRAYYAAMHAVKAALIWQGVAARSHRGVQHLFNFHLVRTGALEREWVQYLANLYHARLAADYETDIAFSAEAAAAECTKAREFSGRIRLYLSAKGLPEGELQARHKGVQHEG